MTLKFKIARHSPHYGRDESGAGSITSLYFLLVMAVLAGIAIDGANAWRARSQMQIAADSAALVAAAHIDDLETARTLAKDITQRNLGGDTAALVDDDIQFGEWDSDAQAFTALDDTAEPEDYNAVKVTTQRTTIRSNSVGTYLLRLVGVDQFEMGATSIALSTTETGTTTVASDSGNSCASATFLSSSDVTAGGSNRFLDAVCVYGANGVSFGGNDYYSPETRVIANDINTVVLNSPRSDSAPQEVVKAEGYMEPMLVPRLDSMFSERWNAFYGNNGQTYSGDLVPDFVKDPATGMAKIVQYDGWWSIQPGQVEPYTIYIVNGGAQFGGDIDAHNVMFMVNGYFGTGGGWNLHFYDMFIFGTQIGLAGNVQWGDPDITCGENRYSVYLFAKTSINMGGWSAPTPIDGLVVAAPKIEPGGSMTGSHLYMESSENFNIGGNWEITGCLDTAPDSYWTLSTLGGGTEIAEVLMRKSKLKR